MESQVKVSNLDSLFHRLAVVNAKLHESDADDGRLFKERREIMDLMTRERLGQAQQIVWKPGDRYMA